MSKNDGETFRHPFGQTDDMENLTKHWPCAVFFTHFPGQHTRSGRNYTIHGVLKPTELGPGRPEQ